MDLFWNKYQEYIRSYLPQWRYDAESGEPEAAVLLAAVELIGESRTRLNQLPQKHEREFLRGWELTPLDTDPMYAYASLTTPEGAMIRKGKEFYMSGDGARLWQTAEDTQAEPARLKEQFLTGKGKIIQLPLPIPKSPVRLFDFLPDGFPGPKVLFAHPDAFSSQHGCQVELIMPRASSNLRAHLCSGDFASWSLMLCSKEQISIDTPKRTEHGLCFLLPAASNAQALHVSLTSNSLSPEPFGPVSVRTERSKLPLGLAWDGNSPCTGERWLPFGEIPKHGVLAIFPVRTR